MPHVQASEMGSCNGAGAAASEPENNQSGHYAWSFPMDFSPVFFWYTKQMEPFGRIPGYQTPSLTWQGCQKLRCPLGTVKQLRKTSATQKVMLMVFPQCIPPFSGETLDNLTPHSWQPHDHFILKE